MKSDVVILQHHEGGWTPAGSTKPVTRRDRPRYSLLCDGAEWVIAEGEQNVWSTLVLFVLQRAKRGGFLSSIDLRDGMVPSFLRAMSSPEAATLSFPTATTPPLAVHGVLSVLQPWSSEIEELDLEQHVTQPLNKLS